MLLFGLIFLYFGLVVIDYYYDFNWKEYTMGITTLTFVIFMTCLMDKMYFASAVWFVNMIIEYKKYINI